jgi:putative glutamine amidotransferase
MTLPALVVGVPACSVRLDDMAQYATPAPYATALLDAAGAIPVLLPPIGAAALAVLDRLDGLLLSGSLSNVEPHRYGAAEDLTPDLHDPARDDTTLALIRAAVARGMPVLAICRGHQELNVAFGGTLHQQVQNVSGRDDHRAGEGEMNHLFRLKQKVTLSGELARLVGQTDITVNSLHEQAIDRLGEGLVAEATAPDGTIEAVRVASCAGWAFGVQWHPEMHVSTDAPSRAIFAAFGAACRRYATNLRDAA